MSQLLPLPLLVSSAMDTDIGKKRQQNQDAIGHMVPTDADLLAELGQIFVLADGVGGLAGGDLASQYAVSTIISSYYEQEAGDPPERLARAIAEANNVIFAEGQDRDKPSVMATTVVAAVVRDTELIIGSVGDSPAYLLRDAAVRQLTLDHNLETLKREQGVPLADDDPTGRKLVRALGSMPSVKVDIITGSVRDGDHVVLCSDGLTRYVTPEEIEETVATRSPDSAVKALIQMANERGGADNISVVVLRLSDADDSAQSASLEGDEALERDTELDTVLDGPRPGYERSRVPLPRPGSARARRAARADLNLPTAVTDGPLADVWDLLRGNAVMTIGALSALLVLFVIIMLLVANANEGDSGPTLTPSPSPIPAQMQTATVVAQIAAATQVVAAQTEAANLQATGTAEVLAQLPPTPMPTYGPQMEQETWFHITEGDPIPAYMIPDLQADPAAELVSQPGLNYKVKLKDEDRPNGPWYQVIANSGLGGDRWVNGPSLYGRVQAVDTSGNPLEDQPEDVPPPGSMVEAVRTPRATGTVTPEGTPSEATATPEATEAAMPATYPLLQWEDATVAPQIAFKLRDEPSLQGVETFDVEAGEVATVIDGPVEAEGHWWWHLQFDDERSGWAAQPMLRYEGE